MPLISPTTRSPCSDSSHLRGQSCQQKGNSLLELMLSLGVMAAVTLSVITMNDKAQNKERGRLAADALQSFTQIAAQYFIANRVELENIMSGDLAHAANFCAINLSSANPNGVLAANALKRTCAIDTSLLKAKGLWPESLPINTGANSFVAVFRQLCHRKRGSVCRTNPCKSCQFGGHGWVHPPRKRLRRLSVQRQHQASLRTGLENQSFRFSMKLQSWLIG